MHTPFCEPRARTRAVRLSSHTLDAGPDEKGLGKQPLHGDRAELGRDKASVPAGPGLPARTRRQGLCPGEGRENAASPGPVTLRKYFLSYSGASPHVQAFSDSPRPVSRPVPLPPGSPLASLRPLPPGLFPLLPGLVSNLRRSPGLAVRSRALVTASPQAALRLSLSSLAAGPGGRSRGGAGGGATHQLFRALYNNKRTGGGGSAATATAGAAAAAAALGGKTRTLIWTPLAPPAGPSAATSAARGRSEPSPLAPPSQLQFPRPA
ncbi:uncharacterized protein [Notamacropus eugenii]|uniref:uncharacterized protein n=1 Tax=Notamacropus eugenii TaxID=9315 RepID=UPI003B67FBBC